VVPPCHLAPLYYQRIASNKEPTARNVAIRAALDALRAMPDEALWPMAAFMQDFDVRAKINSPYVWRVARIVAAARDELPAPWQTGWGAPGGVVGVSPFWPLQAIITPSPDPREKAALWRQTWPSQAKRIANQDPLLPYLLGQTPKAEEGKTSGNTKKKDDNYENNISLTFSRSYAIPSYGLTERLKDVIEKNQAGQSVALILIGYGAIPPDQIVPDQLVRIIEGFKQFGLSRFARQLALEILND